MARTDKLLARARNNPGDVRFSDLLTLVEAAGFTFLRQRGSHRVYRHPATRAMLNLQPRGDGKAKEYQVRAFLTEVATFGLQDKEAP